jgi:hypothetical protein
MDLEDSGVDRTRAWNPAQIAGWGVSVAAEINPCSKDEERECREVQKEHQQEISYADAPESWPREHERENLDGSHVGS